MIYFVILFLILAQFVIFHKNEKVALMVAFAILAMFSGFRFDVGIDYNNYVDIFNGSEFRVVNEKGFLGIISVLKFLGFNSQMLFLVCASLFSLFAYFVFRNFSHDAVLSLMIFFCIAPFYLGSFNGVRQYLAIMFFFAILPILYRKKILFLVLSAVGMFFFHITLIIPVLASLLIHRQYSVKTKIFFAVLFILLSHGIISLLGLTPYSSYINAIRVSEFSNAVYLYLALSVIIVMFQNKIPDFKFKNQLFNLTYFSIIFTLLAILNKENYIGTMLLRINNYFFFSVIFLIPAIIRYFPMSENTKRAVKIPLVLVCLLYLFMTIFMNGERYNLMPFEFNFSLFA